MASGSKTPDRGPAPKSISSKVQDRGPAPKSVSYTPPSPASALSRSNAAANLPPAPASHSSGFSGVVNRIGSAVGGSIQQQAAQAAHMAAVKQAHNTQIATTFLKANGGGGNSPYSFLTKLPSFAAHAATVPAFQGLLGSNLHLGRTDMGVDFTGSGPVPAVINGIVTRVDPRGSGNGWPGGAIVVVKGTGLDAGKFTYLAENVNPQVQVGQRVQRGTTLANAVGVYPFLEYGWAADPHGTTLAHATTGYHEGQVTPAGASFASYLQSGKQKALTTGAPGKPPLPGYAKKLLPLVPKGARKATVAQYSKPGPSQTGPQQGPTVLAGVPKTLGQLFVAAGKKYKIPPAVLAGVAQIESAMGTNRSTSSAGAVGLMQFLPSTAASLGVNPLNDQQAVFGAAKLLNNFGYQKDPMRALGAYNGGPGNPQYGYANNVMAAAKKIGGGAATINSPVQGVTGGAAVSPGGVSSGGAAIAPSGGGGGAVSGGPASGGGVSSGGAALPGSGIDQAAFDKASKQYLAGRLLAGLGKSPFDIGPKIPGLSGVSLAGLFPTAAPNPADYAAAAGSLQGLAQAGGSNAPIVAHPSGGGGSFGKAQLRQLWIQAGGDPAKANIAAAIALAESGGNPHDRYAPGPQEDSRGLWQINVVPGANPQYASTNLYDPLTNAKIAVQMSGNGRNFGPWTTYTSGKYRSFL